VPRDEWQQKLTLAVALVITFAWVTSFLVDMLTSYTQPTSITPLMLIVAGFCFREGITGRRHNGEDRGHEQTRERT
jgi:hypothetical protein